MKESGTARALFADRLSELPWDDALRAKPHLQRAPGSPDPLAAVEEALQRHAPVAPPARPQVQQEAAPVGAAALTSGAKPTLRRDETEKKQYGTRDQFLQDLGAALSSVAASAARAPNLAPVQAPVQAPNTAASSGPGPRSAATEEPALFAPSAPPLRTAKRAKRVTRAEPAQTPRVVDGGVSVDMQLMSELLCRVDAQLAPGSGRIVGFIASGSGEGTTTLASAYATAAATRAGHRVLLLTVYGDRSCPHGVFDSMAQGYELERVTTLNHGGFMEAAILGSRADPSAWALCQDPRYWNALRDSFEEIVIDMPSPAASRIGLSVSAHCSGVIVVLEAEKTRAPVAGALVAALRAVRANVLGTVLNKRKYHVPEPVYRRL